MSIDFSLNAFLNLRRGVILAAALVMTAPVGDADEQALSEIKGYLVGKVQFMNTAASDFVKNASAYQAIIDGTGGDYNKAAMERGPEILKLVAKMQDDYRGFHNKGYENIEGIVAGWISMCIWMPGCQRPKPPPILHILRWF
jgi:hypothetical protein